MMGNNLTLVKAAAIDLGIQWACWAVAAFFQTEKFYDLTGSVTFVILTVLSLRQNETFHLRQAVNSGMVVTWAVRLGTYLFSRILQDGRDKRFDTVRYRPGKFWIYWTIQGVWIFSTLLPTLIVNLKKKKEQAEVNKLDFVGWGLWALGFFFEVVADYQKSQFRANPENAGKFISSGLWSISRHPNYFGEILMFLGLYLSAVTTLKGWEHVSILSPVLLTFLLTKVSGIPLLEAAGRKKWGVDPLYQTYVQDTAKLVPFIW